MHLTALASGPGGRVVVDGLTRSLSTADGTDTLTVVGDTAEDITLCGLRLCPDLDALAETLSPTGSPLTDSRALQELLVTFDAAPDWYPIDDATFARAIARNRWLGAGLTPSEVCDRLTRDRPAGVRLLPMSDLPVESHVVVEVDDTPQAVHVLEWAVRLAGSPAPSRITAAGLAHAHPAPGVLDAVRGADVVALPLSRPVTGVGVMLGLPGLRDALRGTSAPVIGVSPLLLPSRGDEAATLATLDLEFTSRAVIGLAADVLDVCLVPAGEDVGRMRDVEIVEVGPDVDLAGAILECARRAGTRR